jgi:hypothetical protein
LSPNWIGLTAVTRNEPAVERDTGLDRPENKQPDRR